LIYRACGFLCQAPQWAELEIFEDIMMTFKEAGYCLTYRLAHKTRLVAQIWLLRGTNFDFDAVVVLNLELWQAPLRWVPSGGSRFLDLLSHSIWLAWHTLLSVPPLNEQDSNRSLGAVGFR
jgi:hypothetical protein